MMIKIREKEQTKNKQRTTKNNIHDTQTFGVQDKTDNVLIGFAEFLDSLKESAKMVVHSKQIRQIICWKLSAFYGIIKAKILR